MKSQSLSAWCVAVLAGIQTLGVLAQERVVSLYTNFYYFGPVKEAFAAYVGKDGKLVKNGRYRDWQEDGSLWHSIDYQDGRLNGAMVTYHPNGSNYSETI